MPLMIQAAMTSGKIVDGARWLVDLPWVQEGQTVSLNIPIKDAALIEYVSKKNNIECIIDKENNK